MKFFELSAPDYETDKELGVHNPVTLSCKHFIPSIHCDVCGTWASSNRIRKDFDSSSLRAFKGIKFLGLSDWKKEISNWASVLGISEACITPGAELGKPQVELLSNDIDDFLHPMPGQIIVVKSVATIFQENDVSGIELFPLLPEWGRKVKEMNDELPELWELVVKGVGWRKGVDEKAIMACELCGRTTFPHAPIVIDQDRWDGSDIFNVDKNPNRVFVTDKVARLIKSAGFTNYQLKLVG